MKKDNSFQVIVQEESIEEQLTDGWLFNIKKQVKSIFNYILLNAKYVACVLLMVYLLLFVFSLLFYRESLLGFRLQQYKNSESLQADLSISFKPEKSHVMDRQDEQQNPSEAKPLRSVQNQQNQESDEVMLIATPPLDIPMPMLISSNIKQEGTQLQQLRKVQTSSPSSQQIRQQPLQIQANYNKENAVQIQTKNIQPPLTLRIRSKYSNLLSQFDSERETLQSQIIDRSQYNKIDKKNNNDHKMRYLEVGERQALVQRYIQNSEEGEEGSQFIGLALENEQYGGKQTDLDKKFKKKMFKKYRVRDLEAVHSFCVVVSTFNQADASQIVRTFNSIFNQKYSNYKVVVVDQMSSDATLDLVEEYIQKHEEIADFIEVIAAERRETVVEAAMKGLRRCGKDDIAVLMSGSDELLGPYIFRLLDFWYQNKKAKAIYSDCFRLDSRSRSLQMVKSREYDQSDKFMNLYRDLSKRYNSFFTFQSQLAASVPEGMLKNSMGEWFKSTGNDALITSILELTCGQNAYIGEPLLLNQVQGDGEGEMEEFEERQAIARKNKFDSC